MTGIIGIYIISILSICLGYFICAVFTTDKIEELEYIIYRLADENARLKEEVGVDND